MAKCFDISQGSVSRRIDARKVTFSLKCLEQQLSPYNYIYTKYLPVVNTKSKTTKNDTRELVRYCLNKSVRTFPNRQRQL